jgi:phosphoribosylanthranilate isomerase
MQVKVCGITEIQQMQQLADLGVDYAGMIFYSGSKRFVGNKLEPEKVKAIPIKKVGVFVNAAPEYIREMIALYGLHAIQLHGEEGVEDIKNIKGETVVIKAFKISGRPGIDNLVAAYGEVCDYYLFDTSPAATKNNENIQGGTGHQFDWSVLTKAGVNKPFFLSGGIGPADVNSLRAFNHPFLSAIDINSRFEVQPGIKDMELVSEFLNALQ